MNRYQDVSNWTYGAEHEWGDWPLDRALPAGYKTDDHDITIVNSTGVANDPKGRLHRFGGEINTPPTTTIEGQLQCLVELRERYPEATVNYRSNLHLHIRVPGLKDDLRMLQQVQAHIHRWMPIALPVIEPIPEPSPVGCSPEEYRGARRRYNRRKVSHQTLLRPERLQRQLDASTLEDFFAAEVPRAVKDGRPQWHLQPRLCVNLRQLRETDTIEFRHWPGTLEPVELEAAFLWCHEYLRLALGDQDPTGLIRLYEHEETQRRLPRFPAYDHWLEERYRRTVHDGTIPKDQLPLNIEQVLLERRP